VFSNDCNDQTIKEYIYQLLEQGDPGELENLYTDLSLSKRDLANYLGTISSTLLRAFKELEDSSTIEVDKNIIRLK
jgi:CRP-like cAMP-binding protein